MLNKALIAASFLGVLCLNLVITAETGPSTAWIPFLEPTAADVQITSILSSADGVRKRNTANDTYRMVGIPDGLGAYDNGDGTITVLMNQELGSGSGVIRDHGARGSFVSRWQIRKTDLKVLTGQDLIQKVMLWDSATSAYVQSTNTAFSRFCSADLAPRSAFYNAASGKGFSEERLYLNGEEDANTGRAMAHVVTGPNQGTSYQLAKFGKHSWENLLASPFTQDLTIVAANEDGGTNRVFFYVGEKQESGNPVEQAGLTSGALYEVQIPGYNNDDPSLGYRRGNFNLVTSNGTTLNRPEDGAWDPTNPNRYYFVTTASFTGNSRLWRMTFTDVRQPLLGGTIEVVLDGGETIKMMDNMTIDDGGNIYLQEDIGNNPRLGLVWKFEPSTYSLSVIAQHSYRLFSPGLSNLTQDEESSGIIDVTSLFTGTTGYDTTLNRYFLLDVQAHYSMPGEFVEGGQLLMMKVPR